MLHRTIQKVTDDTEALRFNTAIAAMMEFVNHFTKLEVRPRSVLEPFVLLLAPFAPHVAEELWQVLGPHEHAGLRALAEVRPGADEGRRDRDPGAGQRQGEGAAEGAGRDRRQGTGSRGAGRRDGEGPDRRQDDQDGEGRAAEAGERRGGVADWASRDPEPRNGTRSACGTRLAAISFTNSSARFCAASFVSAPVGGTRRNNARLPDSAFIALQTDTFPPESNRTNSGDNAVSTGIGHGPDREERARPSRRRPRRSPPIPCPRVGHVKSRPSAAFRRDRCTR